MKRALALVPIALFATVLTAGPRPARAEEAPLVVGYVTKSATNQGWVLINRGAQDAADDARVKLIVGGPSARGALAGQIDAIERVIAEGAKVVALAPVDSAGLVPIVQRASAGGTPFVTIDTAIDAPVAKSYVATDNLAAARAQAEWTAEAIGDTDEVILVNGSLAQSTGRDRRQGFLDRLKELKPRAAVHEVHTDWDADEARAGVEREMRAHPKVAAIANAWDDGTLGTVAALQSLRVPKGQVRVIGFDGAPNALMLLKAGWVHADVGQMLYRQGYEGIKAAVAMARGETVPPRVNTGFEVVTAENLDRFVADNKLAEFMY